MPKDTRRPRALDDRASERMNPLLAGPAGAILGGLMASSGWAWEAAMLLRSGSDLDAARIFDSAIAVGAVGAGIGLLCGITGLWGGAWWLAFVITMWAWLIAGKLAAVSVGIPTLAVVLVVVTGGIVAGQLLARLPLPGWAITFIAAELGLLVTFSAPLHLHFLAASTDSAGMAVTGLLALVLFPGAVIITGLREVGGVPAVAALLGLSGAGACWWQLPGEEPAWPTSTAEGPLIVLVTVAGLRADHLGAAGYTRPMTPAIDKLASRSVWYREAGSPAPWSMPALASVITSRWPYRHGAGARWNGVATDAAVRTDAYPWPAALAREGYSTAAFIGDPGLRTYGLDRSFQLWRDTPAKGPLPVVLVPAVLSGFGFPLRRHASAVVDDALVYLAARPTGGRFVWVHLSDAGGPFDAEDEDRVAAGLTNRAWPADDYDASLHAVDRAVGRLVEALPPDATLILAGDRGLRVNENRGVDHLWGHHVHRELVHVPLMVRTPSMAAREVEAPVSLVDIGPTVLFFAGVAPLDGIDGVVLARVFGRAEPERIVLSEATRYGEPARAARKGRHRMIASGASERMFDLAVDPLENTALGQDPTVDAVRRELRAQLPHDAGQAAPPSLSESLGQLVARFVR